MNPLRRLLAMSLVMITGLALATSYLELSLEELFARSEVAFFGRVAATTIEDRNGQPWTVVEFEVVRGFRGITFEGSADLEATTVSVELAFLGGELLGGPTLNVNLMPSFEVGERVVVLAYDNDYASPIVGFRQGLWRQTPLGFVDETGRTLSLADDGTLARDGPGAEPEAIFEALAIIFGETP